MIRNNSGSYVDKIRHKIYILKPPIFFYIIVYNYSKHTRMRGETRVGKELIAYK